MPARALLMRLFLAFALVASGPGVAGVSTVAIHVHAAAPANAGAAVDCADAATAASMAHHDHAPGAGQPAVDVSSPGECCGAAPCGTCTHHGAAAVGSTAPIHPCPRSRAFEPRLRQACALAGPGTLFRPPIG